MGGRAGGGARGGGGAAGGARSAYDLGKSLMNIPQSEFDKANALALGNGGMGFQIASNRLTQSAKQKLKANGWKPYRMENLQGKWHTQWESPTFKTLGDLQSHAKTLMGRRK